MCIVRMHLGQITRAKRSEHVEQNLQMRMYQVNFFSHLLASIRVILINEMTGFFLAIVHAFVNLCYMLKKHYV